MDFHSSTTGGFVIPTDTEYVVCNIVYVGMCAMGNDPNCHCGGMDISFPATQRLARFNNFRDAIAFGTSVVKDRPNDVITVMPANINRKLARKMIRNRCLVGSPLW